MTHLNFYLLIAFLFLVPYLLPQLLPKKALVVYSIAFILISSYLAYDIYRIPEHERWDGLGGALSKGFIYVVGFGLFLGILVRAAGYIFSNKNLHTRYYFYLLLVTPLLFWAYSFVPDFYQDWNRRLPTEQCSYDTANLTIGKTRMNVPTFSIASVALDDGNQAFKKMDMLHFFLNQSLRRYCAKTDNGQTRLPVNAFNINFSRVETERGHDKRFKALCEKGGYFFCGAERYFGVVPYIEDLALYYDGHYNANKMYGGTGEALIDELRELASNQSYTKHNFIKIEGLRGQKGQTVTFRCRDANPNLFCQTNVPFSDDVRLITGYVVSHKATEDDLRQLYNDTYNFLESMRASEANNGRSH